MPALSEFFRFGWDGNHRQWPDPPLLHEDAYTLSVIEFDDQGWYHDLAQRDNLLGYLRDKADEDLLVVVFVHGWKHNAKADDTNLVSFRALLQDAQISEAQRGTNRQVLGVYLSWRGRSLYGNPVWANLSFWTRKNAASRVALGSIREILSQLRAFQRARNKRTIDSFDGRRGIGTRLVLAGHSFGGLILFSAVAENLIESVAHERVVRPFGDLVILINPAFEATRYQPLLTALLARQNFPPNQRPCFLAVTATNDDATARAFPIGRWISTRFEAIRTNALPGLPNDAQHAANLNTIGHLSWLTTHHLTTSQAEKKLTAKQQQEAYTPYTGTARQSRDREDISFNEFNAEFRSNGHLRSGWKRRYESGAVLEHVAGNPDNPFWVVSAAPEVIDGHSGIFRDTFLDFLRQLTDDRLRYLPDPATSSLTL